MLMLKRKKLFFAMLLAMLSLGYFCALSNLEINFFLKIYVSIVPLQAGAIIYVGYLRWKHIYAYVLARRGAKARSHTVLAELELPSVPRSTNGDDS